DDLIVGSPIANRNRAETEGLIGYFVNMLALRADLSGNPTFRTFLARVRETSLGAFEHQDLPLEVLVESLHPQRDLRRTPLFEAQVERTPEGMAVAFEGRTLSYRELNARANQLARFLRKRGVGPDCLVGIAAERSLEFAVGLLGILKAGGAYVPLDPGYPKDRLASILEDAKAPILVTQTSLVDVLPPHTAQVVRLDADWPTIAAESDTNPVSNVKPENLSY